jgi:hypothetical protein
MRYRQPPADLVTALTAVRRRVGKLERHPRAVATSVDTGAFTVKDASGNTVVALGKNAATGAYTVQSISPAGAGLVELHQVSFGQGIAVVSAQESITGPAVWVDLATIGPSVTVLVGTTGRVKVTISSYIRSDTTGTGAGATIGGEVGVALTGANVQAVDGSQVLTHIISMPGGTDSITIFSLQASLTYYITGLTPGSTTFTCKYFAPSANSSTFGNRSLVVEPY